MLRFVRLQRPFPVDGKLAPNARLALEEQDLFSGVSAAVSAAIMPDAPAPMTAIVMAMLRFCRNFLPLLNHTLPQHKKTAQRAQSACTPANEKTEAAGKTVSVFMAVFTWTARRTRASARPT